MGSSRCKLNLRRKLYLRLLEGSVREGNKSIRDNLLQFCPPHCPQTGEAASTKAGIREARARRAENFIILEIGEGGRHWISTLYCKVFYTILWIQKSPFIPALNRQSIYGRKSGTMRFLRESRTSTITRRNSSDMNSSHGNWGNRSR